MYIVCVHIHVKPEHREEFIRATLDNARNTVQEPGNLRFDVIQQTDDADRFMLYEVYRDEAGMNAHKETAHYARWRDAVGPWMAEPRQGVKHRALFPELEHSWSTRTAGTLHQHP
jgi:autoinducer 2-degrading protein